MVKSNDARVRYTKAMLRGSFLKLLETKPVNKITVREVCEGAGINRATFYTHYRDCYDLLEQTENELVADFAVSLAQMQITDVTDFIVAVLDMIERNAEVCRTLIFGRRESTVVSRMIAAAHDKSISGWRAQLKKATDAELEMLFMCLSNGFVSVVVDGYFKYSRTELVDFINTTVKGCLSAFM